MVFFSPIPTLRTEPRPPSRSDMTSPIRQRCTSILASLAIVALASVIVVVWMRYGQTARYRHAGDARAATMNATPTARRPEPTERPKDERKFIEGSYLDGLGHPTDTEFVKPLKMSPPPLHDDDILYDQLHNAHGKPLTSHHSGHFRHKMAEVWDPHPQYEIRAFGDVLHLELAYNDKFISPSLNTFRAWENYTQIANHSSKIRGCFYTGVVKGDAESDVAVSLCNGMTGYIHTSKNSYYIEPMEKFHGPTNASTLHRIRKVDHSRGTTATPIDNDVLGGSASESDHCDTTDSPSLHGDIIERDSVHKVYKRDLWPDKWRSHRRWSFVPRHARDDGTRRKRTNEYVIEIQVVVDKSTAEYHKTEENLQHYIFTLMSHVWLLFKDASIGNAISVSLAHIWILKDKDFRSSTSSEMLQKFCEWHNSHTHKYDISLLLTREIICKNPMISEPCNTLGVTEVGSMCNPQSNCAIAKDNGLSTSYSIAHEIGHALGMPHDEMTKCDKFMTGVTTKCIMSKELQNDTKPLWSPCSKHYLNEFLENTEKSKCLFEMTNDGDLKPDLPTQLPGENFDADKQCELVFGAGYKKCNYMPVCKDLWCTTQAERVGCATQHMPWAEGTDCDDTGFRWCYQGECVMKTIITPVHGGWGPWNDWGPCSRSCGGGIRQSNRTCNNPVPAHGGDYCPGKSVRYESCNWQPCGADSHDFREAQCAAFNGNPLDIPGLTKDVRWVPKYGRSALPGDRCKLYCRVAQSNQYYLLKKKVVDGTKCGLNSFDICVNGFCRPGGCDNRLDSNKTLDECGVCDGDNSKCEEVFGRYNISSLGYNQVVVFPQGSSNVNVWQRGYTNDDNFLALADADTGEYILNGEWKVSRGLKDIVYGGLTITYSGAEEAVERITTPKNRKLTKDLILKVLVAGNLRPPDVTYKYTINRESAPKYAWRVYEKEWSKCNSICSGTQYRRPDCVNLAANTLVDDKYCSHLDMESVTQKQDCNTHCQLSWSIVYRGPCNGQCGKGVRKVVYGCFRTEVVVTTFDQNHGSKVDDKHCNVLPSPPTYESCEGVCESTRWEYSDWSECSKSCGNGVQRRTGRCVDGDGRDIDDSHCHNMEKHTEQLCNVQKCPIWAYGDWTPCSVSCGRGFRTRPYFCHVDGRIFNPAACNGEDMRRDSVREDCFEKPCVHWRIGAWDECSERCGTGRQKRSISCVTTEEDVVEDALCSGFLRPNDSRSCNGDDCTLLPRLTSDYDNNFEDNSISFSPSTSRFRWITGAWGQCSRSCGVGTTSRVVVCRNAFGEELEHMCEQSERPIGRTTCNAHACPVEAQWTVGAWSRCSAYCERRRQVSCQTAGGVVVDRCEGESKPAAVEKCVADECIGVLTRNYEEKSGRRYKWKMGKWSACSKSCGKGFKTRQVFCRDETNEVTLVDQYCRHLKRPKDKRPCERNNCDYTWIESDWSQCSATCDRGVRQRNVTCHRVLLGGYVEPTPLQEPFYKPRTRNYCDMYSKPAETEECTLRNCADAYSWSPGPWNECSHGCGKKGRQMRRVFCVTRDGKKVKGSLCPKSLRPPRKRKCNQKRCLYRDCKHVQAELKTSQNKDYYLSVQGKPALVYCYKMDTSEPEEYISFHVNAQNYAEFYDRRLKDVNTCPFNGQRRDNCDCMLVGAETSGLTKFWKVRVNITSLRIIGDDFTFSSQTKGKKIPFATAGDCYSQSRGCPQGRFSVDFSGTSFAVSGETGWMTRGHQASAHINVQKQTVTGKCGGYCGNCEPDPNIGLVVEVT